MLNIFALWMLFATLGAVSVVFPEHSGVELQQQQQPLEAAKVAAKESLHYAVDATRQTGEGIRQTVISASQIPAKAADAVKDVGADVAQVLKDGSQSGLEKIGLARPEKKSYSETIKDEAGNAYHATKDAAGEAVEAIEDKVRQAGRAVEDGALDMGEWVEGGVKETYRKVEDGGFAAKEEVCSTAGCAQEKVLEGADLVGEKASGIAHSVHDRFNAAEGKAMESAGSAYEHTPDYLEGSAEAAKERTSSYGEKIKHVSQQAADIVKGRVAEAVSLLPNVGQGLGYKTNDDHEATTTGDLINNAGEWIAVEEKEKEKGFVSKVNHSVEGLKDTATSYNEGVKEKASEAHETVIGTMDAAVDGAWDTRGGTAGNGFDIADSSKQEVGLQLNDRMVDMLYNLTERTADGALTLKNRTLAVYDKLRWFTATYFFGSCKAAHLFTFSSVYGSSLWVTFLSGYLLSRAIPRQQFGFVQSRIFPTYLRVAASGHAVCLVLFMILHPWPKADRDEKFQHLDLWAILLSTLANIFFLEPRATEAMFQKLKIEKEEGRGEDGLERSEDDETKARLGTIDKKFATFHGYSSVANLLSMIGMTWHLWHLSRKLVV